MKRIAAQRGFTVLETVLASVMGLVLVLAIVGLLAMIDRTERLTGRREHDTATLSQLHFVMDRAFGSLVMMDGITLAPPVLENGRRNESAPGPRARLTLHVVNGPTGPGGALQRLEMVVERSPVPPGWGSNGVMVDTSFMADDPDIRATRGVFELRPSRGRGQEGLWALWWRPLPPTADGDRAVAYRILPEEDPRAVVVADGLTGCRWQSFKDKVRGPEIDQATKVDDLPAYMEMQVATASGVEANWMFEVQWSVGPETAAEAATMEANTPGPGGGPGAPGASGATGATGAAGAPQQPPPPPPPQPGAPGAGGPVRMDQPSAPAAPDRPLRRKGATLGAGGGR